jgi:hypothetical protein
VKIGMIRRLSAFALTVGSSASLAEAAPTKSIECLTGATRVKPAHMLEVRRLLAELPQAEAPIQAEIFRRLEALGKEGVPAMVAQMDDRRKLTRPAIALENKFPGAFEATRFYGPELVVDAMDAILNQITGHGGSIVNGGSNQQRRAAVTSWRRYVAGMRCR